MAIDSGTRVFDKCGQCGERFLVRESGQTLCMRCRLGRQTGECPGRTPERLPLDERVIVCNCAGCGRLLLGRVMRGRAGDAQRLLGERPPMVAGRLKDRPYCQDCFDVGWPVEVPASAAVSPASSGVSAVIGGDRK